MTLKNGCFISYFRSLALYVTCLLRQREIITFDFVCFKEVDDVGLLEVQTEKVWLSDFKSWVHKSKLIKRGWGRGERG